MRILEFVGDFLVDPHARTREPTPSRKTVRTTRAVGTVGILGVFLCILLLGGGITAIPVHAEEINEPPGLDRDVGDRGEIMAGEQSELLLEMSELSRQAAARNEEVKQLEVEIGIAQENLRHRREVAQQRTQEAGQATAAVEQLRNSIDRVAGTRYRASLMDPVTTFLGSANPQNAIDRAAFLAILSRRQVSQVDELSAADEAAAESRRAADQARDEATSQLDELNLHRTRLGQEQRELQRQVEALQLRVDALDRATRELWEQKNRPVLDVELGDLVGPPGAVAAVQAAMGQLGAPYGWGAAGPDAFDCSGLIYWAYGEQGKKIPRTSQAQLAGGTPVERDQLQPGDVVGYYPGATHVGLYIGQGLVVHASDYGIPVQVVSVDSMPWFGASRF